MRFQRGEFVEINGDIGVVVGIDGEEDVPEDHTAVWFGGRASDGRAEAWTIPTEYLERSKQAPVYLH